MVEHTTHNRVVGGSNPPTATSRLETDIAQVPAGARILVAVSGGPHSSALLLALRDAGLDVVAAHFDHRLRAGSEADAEVVEALCRQIRVPLSKGCRREPLPPGSLQAGARVVRHAFLEEARADAGASLVALGHIADDVVEGVLLHLLRGTALAGLRGMPAGRPGIVRPLFTTWRGEIEAFLEARGIVPIRDPANADLRHARARVRHVLLPALEAGAPGISRRLFEVARRANLMNEELSARAGALLRSDRLDRRELAAESPTVRREALKLLFVAAGGAAPGLDRRSLDLMDDLARTGSAGSGMDLPGGLRLRRLYREVEVGPAVGMSPARVTIVRWTCGGCSSRTAAHLRPGAILTLARRSPGLRMRPHPDRGSRKLQDILVDARVPRHRRDEIDLVFADGQLAWIPGVAVDARWVAPEGTLADHVEVRGGPKGLC